MEEIAIKIANQSKTHTSEYTKSDYKATYRGTKHDYDYPDISTVTWYDNETNPESIKHSSCKAEFHYISSKWCHYDKTDRIWGDAPPGGRGRDSKQENKWVLVYKDSSYTKYTIVKVTYTTL